MTPNHDKVQLIGFEKDSELAALLTRFNLYNDYRATLPERLSVIFRQQYPSATLESIELQAVQKCELGGIRQEQSETLMTVQTLLVRVDLDVAVRVDDVRLALDIQLIIRYEGLDSSPTTRTDMVVRAQKRIT